MAEKDAKLETPAETSAVETPETPATETPAQEAEAPATEEKFAKSGKKSKKHLEEVKAEEERQARKVETKKAEKAAAEKPKGATPIVRPKFERRGKKYQEAHKLVEKGKTYTLKDAVALAIKTNPAKFDATLEAHVRLGVDPRQADQNIRTTIVLPKVMVRPFALPSLLLSMRPKKLPPLVLTSPKMTSSSSVSKRVKSISTYSSLLQLSCQNSAALLAYSVLKD